MSSKHTPGPWAVHDHPTDPNQFGHHVTTVDGLTICSVTYQLPVQTAKGAKEATRVANARLIAAAPEMFEALDTIGGLSRALRQGGPDPMDLQGLSDALEEAVDLANSLVAQIEGRT